MRFFGLLAGCWLAGAAVCGGAGVRRAPAYGQVPLSFEVNRGQAGEGVRFVARTSGYTLLVTAAGPELVFRGGGARMRLVGANPKARLEGLDAQAGRSHYFVGERSQWRTEIPHYGRVRLEEVYPGIDLIYYGNRRDLEYDFVVHPGADPGRIRMEFEGGGPARLDAEGNLAVPAPAGEIRQQRPQIYQRVAGARRQVAGGYRLDASGRVGFRLGTWDRSKTLVIDPVLVYSTFVGGSAFEEGNQIAVDASGNVYLTGETDSFSFPVTSGSYRSFSVGGTEAFVAKLNPEGTRVVYATYFGGFENEAGRAIAVDGAGAAYVTGWTRSRPVFPVTFEALQRTFGGGDQDAFVMKLSPGGGSLTYATYLGGGGIDSGLGIAVDAAGNAYVTGLTESTNFPVTAGVVQPAYGGGDLEAFAAKLDPTGAALLYGTYLGGRDLDAGFAIAVDAAGSAYVAGDTYSNDFPVTPGAFQTRSGPAFDAFLAKLDPAAGALVYSTYLGGSQNSRALGVAVDSRGRAFVTGWTLAPDFPTTPGAFQTRHAGDREAFVTKLDPAGSAPIYSTYLGGSLADAGRAIAVDAEGNAFVAGSTSSPDFPITGGAVQGQAGRQDAFLAMIRAAGNRLLEATLLGGQLDDYAAGVAVDAKGMVYLTGGANSRDFPATTGSLRTAQAGGADGFAVKFDASGDLRTLSATPARLVFRGLVASAIPSQTLSLAAVPVTPPSNWRVETQIASGGSWLTVTPAAGAGTGTLTAAVNTAGLALGSHAAIISVVNLTTGNRVEAPVTLLLIPPVGPITAAGIVNAASFVSGPVAQGEIVTIFGSGIGPPALAGLRLIGNRVATVAGDTRVLFGGVAAPIIYSSATQVSAIVPYDVFRLPTTQVQVEYQGVRSNSVPMAVAASSPAIFTQNASGRGAGAILRNEDYSVVSPSNPAPRGSIVAIYATGEGDTNPPGQDGLLATVTRLPRPRLSVRLSIGGLDAEVLYAGAASGLVAGLLQVNARVPEAVTPGDAVPLVLRIGAISSPPGVTLAVR